jgi:hypothetical protein
MTTLTPAISGVPRVNLMPRSETLRRERDAVMRGWMWGVLGAIVVALLIIAAAFGLRWAAEQRLAAEQATSTQLLGELSALTEVSQALAAEQELTDFRARAMAADFAWQPVVRSLASALPADAVLTGFDFVSGGAPQGDDVTLEEGLTGTVAVESPRPIDIVATIRALRALPGVSYADGQSVTASSVTEGDYGYLLNVTLDQSIYSGDFVAGEGE